MNKRFCITAFCLALTLLVLAQRPAPKPLYADPVYNGAADPCVVWNKSEKRWWMFYTNRRANISDSNGVRWVHGTRIGIATSKNGRDWTYRDTADIRYRPQEGYTFWAPDIIEYEGIYHMYLTYVPGIFSDWKHPRNIIHLISTDLLHWDHPAQLPLVNDKVIDADVFRLPDGSWRLWYNNEADGKSIWYADSRDLSQWTDKGKAIASRGEGPKVFRWKDQYWMAVDVWKGLELYRSDDLLRWQKQSARILETPGSGIDDGAIGGHCDVVVNDGRAFLFYFTHPGRNPAAPAPSTSVEARRSVIQVVELRYENGTITADRNQPTRIHLKPESL